MAKKRKKKSKKMLLKIQIDATGTQMLATNEDRSIVYQDKVDDHIINAYYQDVNVKKPAETYGDLAERKKYVYGHMEGTIVVFDEPYPGDPDEVWW